MQTFLTSSTHSSSGGNKRSQLRGFTLIELLISIGIIAVLTAIVIVRYGSFDSTILLKSTAYEIGLNIREAQVRSVSASRGQNGFDLPFGVSFDITNIANRKQYQIFSESESTQLPPQNDVPGDVVQTIEIARTMQIESLCVTVGGTPQCDAVKVDISFKRPEYRALIYAEDGSGPISNVTDARILVNSAKNPSNRFEIVVSQLGQIDVSVAP